jgi:hypothetical protein
MRKSTFLAMVVTMSVLGHQVQLAAAGDAAAARQSDWVKLADRQVGSGLETGTVEVGRRSGALERLQLTATGADLVVRELRVYFLDGDMQRFAGPFHVVRDATSPPYELEGGAREVDRIEMTYKAGVALARQPLVVGVWGDAGRAQDRPPTSGENVFDADWELLGKEIVGPAVVHNVIAIGRQEGRFEAVRLRVLSSDVAFHDVRVVYLNGVTETLAVRRLVRAGDASPPLPLSGEAQFIREIELVHEANPGMRDRAVVQVWARRVNR